MAAEKPTLPLSERALGRRMKKTLRAGQTFFAVGHPAFVEGLERELLQIPALEILSKEQGGIEFRGPLDLIYEVNLRSRLALRLLLRLAHFHCLSYPELFSRLRRFPWEVYLGFAAEVRFEVSTSVSRLHHTGNIAATALAAMREHMTGLGLELGEGSKTTIYLRFFQDKCTVSLDTSGENLYRRGYKNLAVQAPLRETTAAALLQQCDLHKYPVIVDPFCGSGTFLLEAWELLSALPAGRQRNFAFEFAPFFKPEYFARRRRELLALASPPAAKFWGSDLDEEAIAAARGNCARVSAAAGQNIHFELADALTLKNSFGPHGLLVANLPYGIRIGEKRQLADFYRQLGRHLAREFAGWDFCLLLHSHRSALGLKISHKTGFSHGGLQVEALWGRF